MRYVIVFLLSPIVFVLAVSELILLTIGKRSIVKPLLNRAKKNIEYI